MNDFRRRLEDKLEDDEREKKPPIPGYDEEEPKELPLHTREVAVTRFNRKIVGIILAAIAIVTAISLIYALSPKEKKTAQEVAREQEAKRAETPAALPTPPESVREAPKDYAEAGRKVPAGVPVLPATPTTPPTRTPTPGVTAAQPGVPPGGETAAGPTYVPAPVGAIAPQPSPEELRGQSEAEARRKEAMNARKAPVEFSTETGMEAKLPQPTQSPLPQLVPQPPPGAPGAAQGAAQGAAAPGGDDQNMQDEKREFLGEKRKDDPYVTTTLLKPISPFEIKAGTIFPSTLLTGINSDLPGQITAQVSENVYDTVTGQYLLIPQGTRIIGEYDSKVAFGQERVLIVWSRLILPNGNSISLEGMPGVDLSGYAGLKDRVNNHYWKLITGVVLGSIIGASAQVAVGGQGSPNVPPSFGQLAVSGAAQNLNQAGQRITERNLNVQPTIEIAPGMKVNVFATKDLIMRPYTEK